MNITTLSKNRENYLKLSKSSLASGAFLAVGGAALLTIAFLARQPLLLPGSCLIGIGGVAAVFSIFFKWKSCRKGNELHSTIITGEDHLSKLPEGPLGEISSYLSPRDLVSMERVGKRFKKLVSNELHWKMHCLSKFPQASSLEKPKEWKRFYQSQVQMYENMRCNRFYEQKIKNGNKLRSLAIHEGKLYCGGDKGVLIFDAVTLEEIDSLKSRGSISSLVVEKETLYAGGSQGNIDIWDLKTRQLKDSLQVGTLKIGKLFLFEERLIFKEMGIGTSFCDLKTKSVWRISGYPHPLSLAIGNGKLFCGYPDGAIKAWDIKTNTLSDAFIIDEPVRFLFLHQNKLFSNAFKNQIDLWDIDNNYKHIGTLKGHTERTHNIQVFENKIFSAAYDGSIRVWDLSNLKPIAKINTNYNIFHINSIYDFIFYKEKIFRLDLESKKLTIMGFASKMSAKKATASSLIK